MSKVANLLAACMLCICILSLYSVNGESNTVMVKQEHINFVSPDQAIMPGELNGPYTFDRPEGTRLFYLYVPSKYNPSQPFPLTVYFHGLFASWQQGVELNQTVDAETNGHLLAFGQGTPSAQSGNPLGWNGGTCCLFNTTIPVDDVSYARITVAIIQKTVNVDQKRIYAMGWSNGGFMAERLGCEANDIFSGISADASSVILGNGYEDGLAICDKAFDNAGIDILHWTGTIDVTVPWIGGHPERERLPSALENISRWVNRNGCAGGQMKQTYSDYKNFSNLVWDNCRKDTSVEMMVVWWGTHYWWTIHNSNFSTADYSFKFFNNKHQERVNRRSTGYFDFLFGL